MLFSEISCDRKKYIATGLLLITGAVFIAGFALVIRPEVFIFHTPFTEDAFYSLTVARNFAAGNGLTIDGTNLTNGFQPLFTMMEAASYWLAQNNDNLAARIILALSACIWATTGFLLANIARNCRGLITQYYGDIRFAATFLLYIGGFLTFMHHFNGLETGLLSCFYALIWRCYQLGWFERRYGTSLFGLLFGLLVLTRIDAAIFVTIFVAFHSVIAARCRAWTRLFAILIITLGLAVVISSPWWWFNWHYFSSFVPTSGLSQQEWAFDERRWRWVIWAIVVDAVPSLWLGKLEEVFHNGILLSLFRSAVLSSLLLWFFRRWLNERETSFVTTQERNTLTFAALMTVSMLILALYYGAGFVSFWFYYRYLFPVSLLTTVAIAWTIAPTIARYPKSMIILAIFLIIPTIFSALMAQSGKTMSVETVYWDQYQLVSSKVPLHDKVAAGQTGTLGYFRNNVVNIDGKVNTEALSYQNHMWDYLSAQRIKWFADWPYYVTKYLGSDPNAHGWHRVATYDIWELWHHNKDQ